MNTIKLIEDFLIQNNIQLPARDFVETVSNIYHKYESQQYDSHHYSIELSIPNWRKVLDDLGQQFQDKEDLRLLDFGCGTGFATEQVLNSKFNTKCKEIICYDLSPDMIAVCKNKFSMHQNISYMSDREGFEKLKNTDSKLDVIVCNSLIHHVLDHKLLFQVFEEILAPNGMIVIGHEPNKDFYLNKTSQRISHLYRFYKRGNNKIRKFFKLGSRMPKRDDISLLTYNELLQRNIITPSFPSYIIPKFVDIHVPMSTLKQQPWGELGFDKEFFVKASENKLEVKKQISYGYIKDQQAYKSLFWRMISKIMGALYPNCGADAIFVLKRTI